MLTIDELFKIKNYSFITEEFYLKGLEYNIVIDGPFDPFDPFDDAYKPRRVVKKIFPPTKETIFRLVGASLSLYFGYFIYKKVSFVGIFKKFMKIFSYLPIINRFLPSWMYQ